LNTPIPQPCPELLKDVRIFESTMNTGNREYHISIYLLYIIIILYILSHFLAGYIVDNHWSFVHWQYLPTWYIITWIVVLFALIGLSGKIDTVVEKFSSSKKLLISSSAIVFILMLVFQYDSFINGGGNLKIAQIAQTEKIIPRWFEYGTIVTVSIFFKAFKLSGIADNIAGVYAWKLLAFIGTLFSMAGAIKLVRELTCERFKKIFLFVILFFGPQTIIYFGLVGVEPVVVAFTIWYAFVAVKLNKFFTTNRLLLLWFITILGIIFHYSLAFLIPALLYLSLRTQPNKKQTAPVITALASYLILLFLVYYKGNTSLEFSRFLLFIHGENPHSDYGLFSLKHLSDILQIILLSFPQVIVFIYLVFKSPLKIKHNPLSVTALLLSMSGFTLMFILSPINSIVFDFPKMIAYLSPLSFLAILNSWLSCR